MDPELNDSSRIRTTRRVVLMKPHRTKRDPRDQAAVWKQRRRAFGISTVSWLAMAVAGALSGLGKDFVALAVAACLLSAAVVIKAQVLIQRAEQAPPTA